MGRGKHEGTIRTLQADKQLLTDNHDVNVSPRSGWHGAGLIGQRVAAEDRSELGGVDEGEIDGKAETATAA